MARELAVVERDTIPESADAVLLYPSRQRSRPLIIVDPNPAKVRIRFTLAHELGHIAIPWHVGEIAYHQDWHGAFSNDLHRQMEKEANSFASELLMPTPWVEAIMQGQKTVGAMLRRITTGAKVSGPAACLALVRLLPPGHVIYQTGRHDPIVQMGTASKGTAASLLSKGQSIDGAQYHGVAAQHGDVPCGSSRFHWWQFAATSGAVTPSSSRPSREILESIYDDCGVIGAERTTLDHRVSGVIGAANNSYPCDTWQGLHSVLEQRFTGRKDFQTLFGHAEFDKFLAARAKEIVDRRST